MKVEQDQLRSIAWPKLSWFKIGGRAQKCLEN